MSISTLEKLCICFSLHIATSYAFTIQPKYSQSFTKLHSGNFDSGSSDANRWQSSDILPFEEQDDWEKSVNARQDGSLWSSFASSEDDEGGSKDDEKSKSSIVDDMDNGEEAWLDALAKISADEIDFINVEADRADKVRQMQEMEFSSESIEATLGVAVDESQEIDESNVLFEQFKEETKKTGFGMYLDDEYDMETVESHTTIERDEDTGEPVRTQMVYVDEVTCIGCTNCAMIAQSTFFMEQEHGRARVFQQWGDDQETIEIAIETCPVNCIHYVPYDELVKLEVERREQNINFKARLVNGSSDGSETAGFSAAQEISGNMKPRCSNCPTLGCKNCPMFGIGKNPYFEKREAERKMRQAKRRMKRQMEDSNRSADL